MVTNKSAFWQALIFTLVIFGIGLIFGYFLESFRADKSELSLMNSEINILDEQLRSEITGAGNISCELAKGSTFAFADKVYNDALILEKYGSVSKFNNDLLEILHKRYDLLRMLLWKESISLKKRCGGFSTVVYFFDYNSDDISIEAKQKLFSRILLDLKEKYPDRVLLIPIASNLDLASVNLITNQYSIDRAPSILVNEKTKITDVLTFDEFERIVFPESASNKPKTFA